MQDADFPDPIIQDEVELNSDANLGVIHTTINNLSPTISSISSWIHQVESLAVVGAQSEVNRYLFKFGRNKLMQYQEIHKVKGFLVHRV